MNGFELMGRIVGTGGEAEKVKALASEVLAKTRWPARVGAESLASHEREAMGKGMDLLAANGEASLAVLAEQGALANPVAEVWKIRFLAEELLAQRRGLREALKPLFSDERPWGDTGSPRVCDLAYLLDRKLARRKAPEGFVNLPERERNRWIRKLREEVR